MAMIASKDQKEKFACALQNACPAIIGKAQGKPYVKVLFQKPFLMGFLKRNSTADIFLGTFRLFLEKLFHKAPLND